MSSYSYTTVSDEEIPQTIRKQSLSGLDRSCPNPLSPHLGRVRWRDVLQLMQCMQEKWEVLLGIRLPGITFWRGSSNHQAATVQMHVVEKNIVECPPLLGALPPSLSMCVWMAGWKDGRMSGWTESQLDARMCICKCICFYPPYAVQYVVYVVYVVHVVHVVYVVYVV